MSRQSQNQSSSSPPSIPPLSFGDDLRDNIGTDMNEDISPLDPRRFTPNLHASLVSQILALQREVENKVLTINNLEGFLHMTKEENEKLSDNLITERKETRSMRKQLQMLESTTLTALEDIAKEKSEALESLNDTRKRLEASKSKVRSQDEEAQRVQGLWDREKQKWDMEKRNMETKVHLYEGRLKSVLAEVAASQLNDHMYPRSSVVDEGLRHTWYTKESDCTSTRSNSFRDRSRLSGQSVKSNESPKFRAATLGGSHGFGMGTFNGTSLAEELEFDQEDGKDDKDEIDEEVMSPDALPEEAHFHKRKASVQSLSQDQKAWKLLGLLKEDTEQPIAISIVPEGVPTLSLDNDAQIEKHSFGEGLPDVPEGDAALGDIDSETQFSRLSSPKSGPQPNSVAPEKAAEQTSVVETTANQRRKRISAPLIEQTSPAEFTAQSSLAMSSSSSQTVERPLSPPLTPIVKIDPPVTGALSGDTIVEMVSSSTQTDQEQQLVLVTAASHQVSSSMTIPVIEIHPPGSRPPSSHNNVALPPRTKNAGCQANIQFPIMTRSISVQTEKIAVDKRPIDVPIRSLSATGSQSSLAKTGLERIEERVQPTPRGSSRRNVHRPPSLRPLVKPSSSTSLNAYSGYNDNGPLNTKQATGLRRPVRSESLFAGFDSACAKDTLDLKRLDLSSDDDLATVAPIRKTLSKVQNSWKLVPHSNAHQTKLGSASNSTDNLDFHEALDPWLASLVPEAESNPEYGAQSRETVEPALPGPSSSAKQFHIPPKAPIAIKAGLRPPRRSPSAPELPNKNTVTAAQPPFPVPTRSSSRKIPTSISEGAYSPTPGSTTFFSNARKSESRRPPTRNPLRKVRSAAAVTRFTRNNGQPSTPQPTSPSTAPSDSPQLPRMPRNNITSRQASKSHVQQTTHALPQASLEGDATIETPGQQTSVVDAIAQTMVGEWMWKYVRRRKSFGVTDDVDFDEKGVGNGIRHKRWVWLAPYERAVMWSSKQPTSGPALLGKNGRKLDIQSVLDIKDDTPMPKNAESKACFGRSILILTPQRALKFTATTRERHYLWLTALSFLSHSPLGMDDLAILPPLPEHEDQRPPSRPAGGGLRRAPIRDSIRVAKAKSRPSMNGHSYSSPIASIQHSDLESPRMPAVNDDPDSDAAEPPAIPRTTSQTRTHNHARKRSNTGPRPAPSHGFHSFPASAAMSSSRSLKSSVSRDVYSSFPPRGPSMPTSTNGAMGHHMTQLSHEPMPTIRNNFFDAVGSGTVRMEAFVEDRGDSLRERKNGRKQAPPLGNSWAKQPNSKKKDLRYWGIGSTEKMGAKGKGIDMGLRKEDPFRGF